MISTLSRARGFFSTFEIVCVAFLLLVVGSRLFPAPLLWAAWAAGQTGTCPLPMALEVPAQDEQFHRLALEVMGRSTREQPSASELVRWGTPFGVFWAPPGTPVHILLAEQILRFYGDGSRRVRNGDVVLDCGANIGTFVWEALEAGASKVIAIEPSAANVAALHRNFTEEIETGQVVVYPMGLWKTETELTFYSYSNSALDSAVMSTRGERGHEPLMVKVPATSIDKLVAELSLGRVDFIKMDIEGAELEALEGARATIRKHQPSMAIATENLKEHQYEVPRWIRQHFPAYVQVCGWCSAPNRTEIRADVFYFFTE